MDFLDENEPSWIAWFCSLRGNDYFCEIDASYIADDFNLMGLSSIVPNFRAALDIILDRLDVFNLPEDKQFQLAESARLLYGLIHARFIITNMGITKMAAKYDNGDFGMCSRVYCEGQYLLPLGITDTIGQASVQLYCARCNRVYRTPTCKHRNADGAFWGTAFPHLFYIVKPQYRPAPSTEVYVPKICGFKVRHPARLPPPASEEESSGEGTSS
ncbi:hypothetical protein P9112_004244 [Eukaryota sp. TZLM1-RC]